MMKEIKEKITKKIKIYLDCDSDEQNITKLLYFTTNTQYNLNSFLKISKFVPFKYFIPKLIEVEKQNYSIKINFAFPLIEEIVNELIESILYLDLNIYTRLCGHKNIEWGARWYLFEKFVTFNLDPKAINPKRKPFFKDIFIDDTITTKMFIPRKGEEIKKSKKKIKLKKGTYLFKQKILNGKDLDVLIVIVDEKNKQYIAKIIAFQITIHKPDDKIFTNDYLKLCFYNLGINLQKLFDFQTY